jgi:hypothetical protein
MTFILAAPPTQEGGGKEVRVSLPKALAQVSWPAIGQLATPRLIWAKGHFGTE